MINMTLTLIGGCDGLLDAADGGVAGGVLDHVLELTVTLDGEYPLGDLVALV